MATVLKELSVSGSKIGLGAVRVPGPSRIRGPWLAKSRDGSATFAGSSSSASRVVTDPGPPEVAEYAVTVEATYSPVDVYAAVSIFLCDLGNAFYDSLRTASLPVTINGTAYATSGALMGAGVNVPTGYHSPKNSIELILQDIADAEGFESLQLIGRLSTQSSVSLPVEWVVPSGGVLLLVPSAVPRAGGSRRLSGTYPESAYPTAADAIAQALADAAGAPLTSGSTVANLRVTCGFDLVQGVA